MKVVVVGTGYVGLVTGVMLACDGHKVTCLDVDSGKIEMLNRGQLPIYEPGLDQKIKEAKGLVFTTDYLQAVGDAELAIIAVGTPPKEDGSADLSYIYAAACSIIEQRNIPLVVKSTVPPGTCLKLQQYLQERLGLEEITVISNPEFLREGCAIADCQNPDRIVLGSSAESGFVKMRELYKSFIEKNTPVLETDQTTSELIKHASNSFLAVKIGFINDMANLCENVGANIDKLAQGMGLDTRIGSQFLQAGPGFGGSCFPKDVSALADKFHECNEPSLLLDAVLNSNKQRAARLSQRIIKTLPIGQHKIGVLGLSFKANTDDIRQSPAIAIIKALKKFGCEVIAYDPIAMDNVVNSMPEITVADDPYSLADQASAVIILTEWDEFKTLNYGKLFSMMKHKYLFDYRNILSSQEMIDLGFKYQAIGK